MNSWTIAFLLGYFVGFFMFFAAWLFVGRKRPNGGAS